MNWYFFAALLAASAVIMALEMRGYRTTLTLKFKGDIKRETAWLAQWGQFICTVVAAALVYSFKPHEPKLTIGLITAVAGASVTCFVIKRLAGRVRPNRENAGKFLGPSLTHANWRESFPSSHSACGVALSVALVMLFPPGAVVFWALGIMCAVLRYVLDAHWPSDVLAGIALGYACGVLIMQAFGATVPAF